MGAIQSSKMAPKRPPAGFRSVVFNILGLNVTYVLMRHGERTSYISSQGYTYFKAAKLQIRSRNCRLTMGMSCIALHYTSTWVARHWRSNLSARVGAQLALLHVIGQPPS